MYPQIERFLADRVAEFGSISKDRRAVLDSLREWIAGRLTAKAVPRLLFVCTHNSRRSQMAQIWARTTAWHYGIQSVETFSGGTEVTAFNIRALGAVRRTGFAMATRDDGDNQAWRVRFDRDAPPLDIFSKPIKHKVNPKKDFCAIMTCTEADVACPTVAGASQRLSLPYDDPGHTDGTLEEIEAYDACGAQIAREMAFVFTRLG